MTDTERALFDWESTVDSINKEPIADQPSQAETTSSTRSKRASMDIAGSVFLIASDGRLLSLPIPSESPSDPLNFERRRRIFIYATLLLHSATCMFSIQSPGNLYKAFLHTFTKEVCEIPGGNTGSPTMAANEILANGTLLGRYPVRQPDVDDGTEFLFLDSHVGGLWQEATHYSLIRDDVRRKPVGWLHQQLPPASRGHLSHGSGRWSYSQRGMSSLTS